MKVLTSILILSAISFGTALSQQTSFRDSLLDRMTGKWVMTGTIAGEKTTHDVVCDWVLAHNYFRIHEVSREKTSGGEPLYEAIVFIGRDNKAESYQCLWLDVTGGGGLCGDAIGSGRLDGERINFLFKGPSGSVFHTTFVCDHVADKWEWIMDGEENGKLEPFARLTLTRE